MAEPSWQEWRAHVDLDEYETRWDRLEAEGADVHGEANFLCEYQPSSVLDGGCGMGRVGIELARRGIDVVGVDADPDLLDRAIKRGPRITWHHLDMATMELGTTFDIVAFAGNVLPFADRAARPRIVAAAAAHLTDGGRFICGNSLHADWPQIVDYDEWAEAAGLVLAERFASWAREPFTTASDYAVSVYQRGVDQR